MKQFPNRSPFGFDAAQELALVLGVMAFWMAVGFVAFGVVVWLFRRYT